MMRSAIPSIVLAGLAVLASAAAAPAQTSQPASRPAAEVPAEGVVPPGAGKGLRTTNTRIELKSVEGDVSVFMVRPTTGGPYPAVVVAHEWWGLNDQIRGLATRLAAQGYVVLAPDLYHGIVATDPEKAHELLRGLDDDRAVGDMSAAVVFAKKSTQVDGKPVGVMGFCMGGRIALLTSMSGTPVDACVMFYGAPVTHADQLAKVDCPVLALFGADDQGITPRTIEAFESGLKAAGKSIDVHTYEGAGHAFMNETRDSYRPGAAADAWARMEAFLDAHLRK